MQLRFTPPTLTFTAKVDDLLYLLRWWEEDGRTVIGRRAGDDTWEMCGITRYVDGKCDPTGTDLPAHAPPDLPQDTMEKLGAHLEAGILGRSTAPDNRS